MGHLARKELRIERRNLCNLTGRFLFVYAFDGSILVLTPDIMPLDSEVYLIAQGKTLEKLTEQGKRYLLEAVSYGVGRDGHEMTKLILYSDSSYRIYPIRYSL